MKNLDLLPLGIQEMNAEEIRNINGGFGFFAAVAIGLAIAAGAEIFSDWDNFKAGLRGDCET